MLKFIKWTAIVGAIVVLMLVGIAFALDVPRFVIGIVQYGDQVREGSLVVGDPAPQVTLYDLDGVTQRPLTERFDGRPLVLIFGSFT